MRKAIASVLAGASALAIALAAAATTLPWNPDLPLQTRGLPPVAVSAAPAPPPHAGALSRVLVPIPEPSSLILFGSGLAGLALLGRKRLPR